MVKNNSFDMADYTALMRSGLPSMLADTPGLRFDSEEDASIYFARELDFIKAKTYDKVYPDLSAMNLFPITSEVDPGAETITYYGYERTGTAKVIGNYATDLPRVDVRGEPHTAYVKSLGASYGYSVQEMRAAKMVGKSLDAKKADSARYAIDYLNNKIAWVGDKQNNLVGVLSQGNDIPLYTVPAGASGKTEWKHKTAQEILADINGMQAFTAKITRNSERPDKLALSAENYIEISTRQLDHTDTTVLSFVQKNAPYLKEVFPVQELQADAGDTNPYGQNIALMYSKDADKFAIENPIPFLQHPLQPENLEIKVPCEARTAGVMIYYPLSLLIAVGV